MSFRHHRVRFLYALSVLALMVSSAAAQEWDAPARELAEKIVAHTQSRSGLSLTVKNLSSLAAARAADVHRILETELRRRGLGLVSSEQAVEQVRVTLSENVAGYLWVAEVGHDESWDVVMVQTTLPITDSRQSAPALVLRRSPVWTQPEPMLDVVTSGDGGIFVLGSDSLAVYRLQGREWRPAGTAAITHSLSWPRDLRGRLILQTDGSLRAYLPGVQCLGTSQPQLSLACHDSDDPWPLSSEVDAFFSSRRNFFTGAVKLARSNQAGNLSPFYSVAMFGQGERGFWIAAFADGSVRLINAHAQTLSAFSGWGDVTGLMSDCGSGWQVLATRASDYTLADSLAAYEVVNRDAVETGAPLEFAGPITALWSAGDGRSATVIADNLRTGNYEAFSVSAVCSR